MTLPMARAPFACTGCGDCCRGFRREAATWEPERGPVVRLSGEPGLPLLSWEAHRLRALAAARGLALDLQPFDAVLDELGERIVVLGYRLLALECPFLAPQAELDPGPRSAAWGFPRGGACSVYEHRPLACRAYPLVPLRNGLALSIHCPELLDADPGSDAELDEAYPGCAPAARAFRAAPQLAVELLTALERAGRVRVAREGGERRAHALQAGWPLVDVCDLAAEHGLAGWQELEARGRGEAPAPDSAKAY